MKDVSASAGPRILARFKQDRRGQSGIEFALLLPLIVLLVAATIDLGQALMVKRKIDQIAEVTADIVSQEQYWTSAQISALFGGSTAILNPFDPTDLKVVVAVLNVDAAGNGKVAWSASFQTLAPGATTAWPDRIAPEIVESGVQLVVTRVDYSMETSLTALLATFTDVSRYSFVGSAIARPRLANTVDKL